MKLVRVCLQPLVIFKLFELSQRLDKGNETYGFADGFFGAAFVGVLARTRMLGQKRLLVRLSFLDHGEQTPAHVSEFEVRASHRACVLCVP